MNTHELPLVTFTVLAQLSVGAFVVLGLVQTLARRRFAADDIEALSDPALYAIGPAMVLGLIASMLHLGNPINAMNSILGVGHSWLSREILFGVAFAGLGALFALLQWRRIGAPAMRQALAGVTAIAGLLLVFSMAKVYMLSTVPAWNSLATPVAFFTTTLLLGNLSVGAAFMAVVMRRGKRGEPEGKATLLVRQAMKSMSIWVVVLVGVSFVTLPLYAMSLATQGGAAAESATLITEAGGGWLLAARLVLLFVGAALIALFVLKASDTAPTRLLAIAAYWAIVLVLTAEVIGRILFYASFQNVGW